jgi:hypothetical protein
MISDGRTIAGSTELFIEDQAFSPSYDSDPPQPPPLSPVSKLDKRNTGRLRKRDNSLKGGGVGEEEPNHTTARKPGPL